MVTSIEIIWVYTEISIETIWKIWIQDLDQKLNWYSLPGSGHHPREQANWEHAESSAENPNSGNFRETSILAYLSH